MRNCTIGHERYCLCERYTYYIKYVTFCYINLFNAIERRARDSYYGDMLAKYQMTRKTIYFTPTGPDEVIKIIQSFKTQKKRVLVMMELKCIF